MEMLLVYLFGGIKILFALALLLGGIPAWFFKSKGGGNLLWTIYIICIAIASLMLFLQIQLDLGDGIRDLLFASDSSPYAMINHLFGGNGHGMSYSASNSITTISGLQFVGMVYCLISFYLWKKRIRNNSFQEK
jgi:hypothetical protein